MPHTAFMEDEEIEVAPRPFGTWALVTANIIVYVLMNQAGVSSLLADVDALVHWGAADAVAIWRGEIWRLGSAMFIHGAFWHLALNLWVLYQVGPILESVLGTPRYLFVYLSSGLFGFACSLLFSPGISVGASGAIFGVVGGLFALILVAKQDPTSKMLLRALTPFVVATLVIGFLLPFVDNSAHVGGMLAGFLAGYGLLADDPTARLHVEDPTAASRAGRANTALMLFGVLFVVLVPLALKPVFSPRYEVAMGWDALAHGKATQAQEHADAATALAAKDAAVLVLQGRLALDHDVTKGNRLISEGLTAFGGEPATALALAQQRERVDSRTVTALCNVALERTNNKVDHEVLNNCAWHLLTASDVKERDPKRALKLALAARDAIVAPGEKGGFIVDDSVVAAYWHTLATAYDKVGNPEEAAAILDRLIVQGLADGLTAPTQWYKKERNKFRDRAASLATRKASSKASSSAAPGPTPKGVPSGLKHPAASADAGTADWSRGDTDLPNLRDPETSGSQRAGADGGFAKSLPDGGVQTRDSGASESGK